MFPGWENCYHCACFPGCFLDGRVLDVTGGTDKEPVYIPDGNTDDAVCRKMKEEKERVLRDRGRG